MGVVKPHDKMDGRDRRGRAAGATWCVRVSGSHLQVVEFI